MARIFDNTCTLTREIEQMENHNITSIMKYLTCVCESIFQEKEVTADDNFFKLGGDSLLYIGFLSKITQCYDVDIVELTQDKSNSITLAELSLVIFNALSNKSNSQNTQNYIEKTDNGPSRLKDIVKPKQKMISGSIMATANRYEYFFQLKHNLEYWLVCSPVVVGSLDILLFKKAVFEVIKHHDALRLVIDRTHHEFNQIIIDTIDEKCFIHFEYDEFDNKELDIEFVKDKIREVKNGFSFAGPLFKVMCLTQRSHRISKIFIIAHHLLADAYSFRLVISDIFSLYNALFSGVNANLPAKTTSYPDYVKFYYAYWQKLSKDAMKYWLSFSWKNVQNIVDSSLITDKKNTENYSREFIKSIYIADEIKFLSQFNTSGENSLANILLSSITCAYKKWLGHHVIYLAMVFHGRDSKIDGLNLTRTVGWISDTVPMLLEYNEDHRALTNEVSKKLDEASQYGMSYGFLRHICKDEEIKKEMRKIPTPQICFNFVTPSLRKYNFHDAAVKSSEYTPPSDYKPSTERVFLIRGGAYLRENKFSISWDYSNALFEDEHIENFTTYCMNEFTRILRHLDIVN